MKLDLYKVHYDRQCGDTDLTTEEQKKCDTGDYTGIIIEQVATKTFGDAGSYSEALNNPRMFMWNANKQLLFLPATIYHNYSQTDYRRKDFFNGMLAIQIDPSTGISEQFRVTHIDMVGIEAKRLETCEKYTVQSTKDCHTLIGGGEYCAPSSGYRYVPSYCYADSDISEYIAANSWNFRESFIERAVWLDDVVYGLSNAQMSSHNMNT
ncbi:MAG: beta-propeller domain-containing protein [Candidatus Peribacteria bacterium]|nr:MAG: beta-propeller domain-containing protein [Candidatus Peribacteria bacterium]